MSNNKDLKEEAREYIDQIEDPQLKVLLKRFIGDDQASCSDSGSTNRALERIEAEINHEKWEDLYNQGLQVARDILREESVREDWIYPAKRLPEEMEIILGEFIAGGNFSVVYLRNGRFWDATADDWSFSPEDLIRYKVLK